MSKPARVLFLLAFLAIATFTVVLSLRGADRVAPMSDLIRDLKVGNVESISWQGETISAKLRDGSFIEVVAVRPSTAAGGEVMRVLIESDARWRILAPPLAEGALRILSLVAFPIIIVLLLYFFVLRPAARAGPSESEEVLRQRFEELIREQEKRSHTLSQDDKADD